MAVLNKKNIIFITLVLLLIVIGGITMFFTIFQSNEVKAVRLASERTRVNLGEFGEIIDFKYSHKPGYATYVDLQIEIDNDKVDAAVKAIEANMRHIDPDNTRVYAMFAKICADEKLGSYDSIENYERVMEGKKVKTVHVCVSIVEIDGKTYLFYRD
ncbi:MAG: hypothetical protein IKI49_06005 [Oscillospiraceae bacterium]|nr:hypothetical protein [Oscillospiraceae bacterium]